MQVVGTGSCKGLLRCLGASQSDLLVQSWPKRLHTEGLNRAVLCLVLQRCRCSIPAESSVLKYLNLSRRNEEAQIGVLSNVSPEIKPFVLLLVICNVLLLIRQRKF